MRVYPPRLLLSMDIFTNYSLLFCHNSKALDCRQQQYRRGSHYQSQKAAIPPTGSQRLRLYAERRQHKYQRQYARHADAEKCLYCIPKDCCGKPRRCPQSAVDM